MQTLLIYILVFLFFAMIVLGSSAIKHMGETRKLKYFWFGYIPILQFYIVGKLIETIDFPNFRIPKAEYIFPLLPVFIALTVSGLLFTSISGVFLLIVLFILSLIWLYAWNTFFLLFVYHQKKAAILTFIGGVLIFPLYPIIFFIRKNKRIDEL